MTVNKTNSRRLTRREFIGAGVAAAGGLAVGAWGVSRLISPGQSIRTAQAFIGKAADYNVDLGKTISAGLRRLGVGSPEIKGRKVLLKPNLVEPAPGVHVTTHPAMIHGAARAFLSLGAAEVIVAEGPGHCTDHYRLLDQTGLGRVLVSDGLRFVNLNDDQVVKVNNAGGYSKLGDLILPRTLIMADWVVSMPKMKTHHWVGATLSMKNLIGVMPGAFYGWPKNVIHRVGISPSVLDINATVRPNLAIVDGVVGMEGDGPIMGTPHGAGVIVMGRNLPAVDATCCRIMGLNPAKVPYLAMSRGRFGPIDEGRISQRGEAVASVRTDFGLVDKIPAHRGLRL